MFIPDWRLPTGITRGIWELAHDPAAPSQEPAHLADSPLLAFDQLLLDRWIPHPCRVVDLGAGTGRHVRHLAARGCDVVAVDLSQPSLTHLLNTLPFTPGRVAAIRANLCELESITSHAFDAALLMFGTLGMIRGRAARQQLLNEAARLLRPGGLLIVHVNNLWRHAVTQSGRRWLLADLLRRLAQSPTAGDTYRTYRGIPNVFHHSFTAGELRTLIRRANLRLVHWVPLDLASAAQHPAPLLLANLQAPGWIAAALKP